MSKLSRSVASDLIGFQVGDFVIIGPNALTERGHFRGRRGQIRQTYPYLETVVHLEPVVWVAFPDCKHATDREWFFQYELELA